MQISVIIPTYNRARFLERAIRSVFAQTYKPSEIIVIDDGSTDNTKEIVKKFLHVQYIYQKNSGVSSARNRGVEASNSEWVAFLDSDDEWKSDKLGLHVALHVSNPSLHVSYTDEQWIRDGKEVRVPKKYAKYGGDIFEQCLSHCIIAPSSVLIHKAVFEDIGLFDEGLEVCEDYDLWLRISSKYEVGLIDKPLITKHAGHSDQLSFKHWGMDRFRVEALEKIFFTCKSIEQKAVVKNMLIHKITLLIKGFQKHKKKEQEAFYKAKLDKIL